MRDKSHKRCPACGETLPAASFGFRKNKPQYLNSRCKPCGIRLRQQWAKDNRQAANAHKKKWQDKNKDRVNGYRIKSQYGLTLDAYNLMYDEQAGKCKICLKMCEVLDIDHCHTSGEVRGLLCNHCNTALGRFKDSEAAIEAAIRYIEDNE